MLEEILNTKANDLQAIYKKVHCLAELSVDGSGKKQPKVYDKAGQLLNASDFDNEGGLGYFRHDGDMNLQRDAIIEPTTSCAEHLVFEYPMKFVGAIQKNKFTDNAFTDDNIILTAIRILEKRVVVDSTLAYEIVINRASSDSIKIIGEEYAGVEFTDFNYNLSYIAIYFTLRIGTSKDCLPECVN